MNIFITLDYELFLGRETGTVKNCLVVPTTLLMDILSETNTKVSFMVDGAYLYRLMELKDRYKDIQNDFEMVRNNLTNISKNGHSIQYHFHPQWLFSEYEAGKGWVLDYEHYKLCDVPEEIRKDVFRKGIGIINDITGACPCAFRAGGFSLCSYETYGNLFEENGLLLDSSVIIGSSINSKFQVFNYKDAPSKSLYYFYKDVCKEEKGTDYNKFIEMPISCSDRMTSISYLIKKRKLLSELNPQKYYGDGVGVSSELPFMARYKEQLRKLFGMMRLGGSIDGFLSSALWTVYDDCKKRGNKNMVLLGHPKLTTDKSLINVKRFVKDMIIAGNEFHTLDEIVTNKNLRYEQ